MHPVTCQQGVTEPNQGTAKQNAKRLILVVIELELQLSASTHCIFTKLIQNL